MSHHHSHHHPEHAQKGHHHGRASYNRAFIVGLVLNGGFVLTEFGFGWIANSVALMADAGHNLSDVLGLLLAWVATLFAAVNLPHGTPMDGERLRSWQHF